MAETLLQYNEAGCGTLLIRGYDPVQDAADYGRDLLPIVREEVRIRDMRAQNEADRAAIEVAKQAAQASDSTAPAASAPAATAPAVTR